MICSVCRFVCWQDYSKRNGQICFKIFIKDGSWDLDKSGFVLGGIHIWTKELYDGFFTIAIRRNCSLSECSCFNM